MLKRKDKVKVKVPEPTVNAALTEEIKIEKFEPLLFGELIALHVFNPDMASRS